MNRKHDARITVITKDEDFKRQVQMKALLEGTDVSKVVVKLLKKWLKSK